MNKRFLSAFVLAIFSLALMLSMVSCGDEQGGKPENNNSGFAVVVGDNTVALGADASVVSEIGTPNTTDDAGACGKLGTLKRYTYNSLIIDVLESSDSKTIDYISVLDDLVSTDKGIRIGNIREDVIAAYGEPDASDDSYVRYTKDNYTIKFVLTEGKVVKIDLIRTTANG